MVPYSEGPEPGTDGAVRSNLKLVLRHLQQTTFVALLSPSQTLHLKVPI